MKVIADFCIVPIGTGVSVSKHIAECLKILAEEKTNGKITDFKMHAYGTGIEGEWNEVFTAIKKCHEHLHSIDVTRISTSIRLGTRTDKEQSMKDKVTVVECLLDKKS